MVNNVSTGSNDLQTKQHSARPSLRREVADWLDGYLEFTALGHLGSE